MASQSEHIGAGSYPVSMRVDEQFDDRNRLTTFFRFILAIPHLFLSGTVSGTSGGSFNTTRGDVDAFEVIIGIATASVLAIAAAFCAFLSWFAILFTGRHPQGLWNFEYWVLRWQVRTTAYLYLFRDEYPPFGEGEYPADVYTEYPERRDRLSVGLRIIYAIPHIIVLVFLGIAWGVTTFIAWFAILFTGRYPAGLWGFGQGVMRWSTRVSAYMYLLRDEYPPFAFED